MKAVVFLLSVALAINAFGISMMVPPSSAEVLFRHDFENGTSGAVDTISDLGAPEKGSFSYGFFGTGTPEGGLSTGNKAFLLAHRQVPNSSLYTPMSQQASAFEYDNTRNYNRTIGGYGSSLRLDFDGPGTISAEENVSISFDLGSFGNNNPIDYKYIVVSGVKSDNTTLFTFLYQAGSTASTRNAFVQSNGLNYFGAPTVGSIAGIEGVEQILGQSDSSFNSIDPSTSPSSMMTVNITLGYSSVLDKTAMKVLLSENGVPMTMTSSPGAEFGLIDETEFPSDPDPRSDEIVALEFTAIWAPSVNSQNKGLWLDNIDILSYAVPEPSTTILLGFSMMGLLGVRRRR